MNVLASLATEEQRLYDYVISLTGTLETKNHYLEKAGIFTAYREVHRQYLVDYQVVTSKSMRLELLKRLVFLNWYGTLEHSFLTGIDELDEDVVFTVYELLDEYIDAEKLDEEFYWMVSFYSN